MKYLISKVLEWADERELLKPENSTKQLLKTMEELGEVASAEIKNDRLETIDGIGDTIVCLIIYANQKGLTLEDCLLSAYDEIKNRKGETVNGSFIKE